MNNFNNVTSIKAEVKDDNSLSSTDSNDSLSEVDMMQENGKGELKLVVGNQVDVPSDSMEVLLKETPTPAAKNDPIDSVDIATVSGNMKTLLAYHFQGRFLAHVGSCQRKLVKTGTTMLTSPIRTSKVVHILNCETGQELHISTRKEGIIHLEFAHWANKTILGWIDGCGNVSVIEIKESEDEFNILSYNNLLSLVNPNSRPGPFHSLAFSYPSILDTDDENNSLFLAVVQNARVEVFDVMKLQKLYDGKELDIHDNIEHRKQIHVEAAVKQVEFCPTAMVLAILSRDKVGFYELDFNSDAPAKFLQDLPRMTKTNISQMLFMDNLLCQDLVSWSLCVICSEGNTCLEVYDMTTWEIVQKLTFLSAMSLNYGPKLQVTKDINGQYLTVISRSQPVIYFLKFDPTRCTYIKTIQLSGILDNMKLSADLPYRSISMLLQRGEKIMLGKLDVHNKQPEATEEIFQEPDDTKPVLKSDVTVETEVVIKKRDLLKSEIGNRQMQKMSIMGTGKEILKEHDDKFISVEEEDEAIAKAASNEQDRKIEELKVVDHDMKMSDDEKRTTLEKRKHRYRKGCGRTDCLEGMDRRKIQER